MKSEWGNRAHWPAFNGITFELIKTKQNKIREKTEDYIKCIVRKNKWKMMKNEKKIVNTNTHIEILNSIINLYYQ